MEKSIRELCGVLGLAPGASAQEVKQAYRDLVQFWHPDKHAEKSARLRQLAEDKMKEINEAYETLKNGVPHEATEQQQEPITARSEVPPAYQTWQQPAPPAWQLSNPNSGCAITAATVTFLACFFFFSEIVFVHQIVTKPGGFFSAPQTALVTSWFPVVFWTLLITASIYWLVLWKRGKPFFWIAWLLALALFNSRKQQQQAPPVSVPGFFQAQ
jgi:hypothetical protein